MRWATTVNGKAIPLDAEPTPDGNIIVEPDGTARVVGTELGIHTSHFATCPNAASHRRRATPPA